ncbi:Carboxylesterase 1C [Amphibalanus amphitrite]|uniref:Carboxylic ester hydrolase n=1 Tax=Amphibalanus amphitrite TaxID=1232801 RepID=A0A6A4VNV5_AMPAM|nr:Carboxylesterase 1C [Amphibalanus amphitrite]
MLCRLFLLLAVSGAAVASAATAGDALPLRLQLLQEEQEDWSDAEESAEEPADEDPFLGFRAADQWPPGGVSLPLSPPVTLADGVVTGQVYTINPQRTTLAYQGIPFGEPTNGSLRFMPPVKRKPYGAINATYPSYNCPQSGLQGPGTEDCLYLNVYTPKLPNATHNPKMAVMVFIYGGAFVAGGSNIYYPGRLQKDRDIVLVTPHYRLGALGFFTTLTDDAPGNVALLDQVLALQWVQDNIAAFGGDPDKVTIFGESAGGASVSLLLVSPLAKGLFRAAIAESGSAVLDWAYNEEPLATGRDLATRAGCPLEPISQMLDCMRSLSAEEMVELGNQYAADERSVARNGFDGLNPVVQPATVSEQYRFLPKDPTTLIREGNFNSVPTIHGANKNEGSFVFGLMYNDYMKVNNLTDDTDFLRYECISKMLYAFHVSDPTDGVTESISNQYFYYVDSWDVDTMYPGLEDLTGVFGIKAGAKKMADMLSSAGTPSWMYSFDYRGKKRHTMSNFLFIGDDKLPFEPGVTHADELMYLFPIPLMTDFNDEEKHVSQMMTDMWTNFAMELDPTPAGSGLTRWPQVSEGGAYLQIAATATVKHDFSQTFDISVQEYVNASLTTPAPSTSVAPGPSTSPAPPATSTESSCQREMERLSEQRDTYRGATIGLAVLAGVGALLLIAAVTMMSRSRRRGPVSTMVMQEKPPHA